MAKVTAGAYVDDPKPSKRTPTILPGTMVYTQATIREVLSRLRHAVVEDREWALWNTCLDAVGEALGVWKP